MFHYNLIQFLIELGSFIFSLVVLPRYLMVFLAICHIGGRVMIQFPTNSTCFWETMICGSLTINFVKAMNVKPILPASIHHIISTCMDELCMRGPVLY